MTYDPRDAHSYSTRSDIKEDVTCHPRDAYSHSTRSDIKEEVTYDPRDAYSYSTRSDIKADVTYGRRGIITLGGIFCLASEEFGRMLDNYSFPAFAFFFFFLTWRFGYYFDYLYHLI